MGEDGRFDAFETTLEVLRVKAAYPRAPPEQYRALDADFDAFLDCRDPPSWNVSVPLQELYAETGPGSVGRGEGGGGGGSRLNPLCSHAYVERENPCERLVLSSAKTHGPPGGLMCARSKGRLAECPRTWL